MAIRQYSQKTPEWLSKYDIAKLDEFRHLNLAQIQQALLKAHRCTILSDLVQYKYLSPTQGKVLCIRSDSVDILSDLNGVGAWAINIASRDKTYYKGRAKVFLDRFYARGQTPDKLSALINASPATICSMLHLYRAVMPYAITCDDKMLGINNVKLKPDFILKFCQVSGLRMR